MQWVFKVAHYRQPEARSDQEGRLGDRVVFVFPGAFHQLCLGHPAMPRVSARQNVATAVAVLVATLELFAQQSGAPPQAPTFRSSLDIVAVDFLAVDSQGRPLADLQPSELRLRVDGKVREVRSLQLVRVGRTARTRSVGAGSHPAVAAVRRQPGSTVPSICPRVRRAPSSS